MQLTYLLQRSRFSLSRYLDHNNITIIHNHDFLDLNRLQHLKLSYSNISVIQGNPFDALQDLGELYLDHNQLTDEQLSANLTGPPSLHFLDLTSNRLDRFPNVSRSRFHILTALLISQNNIWSLHHQEMGNLTYLRQLVIKSNYIEEIDNDAFAWSKQTKQMVANYGVNFITCISVSQIAGISRDFINQHTSIPQPIFILISDIVVWVLVTSRSAMHLATEVPFQPTITFLWVWLELLLGHTIILFVRGCVEPLVNLWWYSLWGDVLSLLFICDDRVCKDHTH